MKRITVAYAVLIVLLTIVWATADSFLSSGYEFFALRASLIQYTGVIGIGAMSVAMILALRLVSIEPLLGGLARAARLHKWLGSTGLVFSLLHFLLANIPKLMVGAGWLGFCRKIRYQQGWQRR